MSHANAFDLRSSPGPGDTVAGAWRRLWHQRGAEGEPAAGAAFTTGVTYRGYLGANGGVSDSWLSEQQAKETQALLRMAAAAGRLGAWSVELAGASWVWSDEVKAIHEVAADYQPSGTDALSFYTPASQDLLVEAFDACARQGQPFDLELQLITARGREVWIRAIGEAECDAAGRVTHVRGAIQDISRFRAVADEARRAAERLTQTLEAMADGYILLDDEWCFLYLNPEAARILRRERSELIGRCLLTEFPETASGRFLQKCQDAVRDGTALEFNKFYPPLSIWLQMKIWPSEQGLTLCVRDDTERVTARREILQLKAQLAARGP
ncbi:PAS domain-containing protein [uncultured Ramlibacter sp.]|mgnify:CR=1 FL=1|uniref:PAS domain-containing protein n=1 Tax=uncultured Ramlibacter sp. TaxID=260755 RepID=UPI00262B528B|nr:PAS domain-containing protein [uncultured Ramlibacter sp.]